MRARLFCTFVLVAWVSGLQARNPWYGGHYVVAGRGEPGEMDGKFGKARFRTPRGVALDTNSERLFVADAETARIRVVSLDDYSVSTLSMRNKNHWIPFRRKRSSRQRVNLNKKQGPRYSVSHVWDNHGPRALAWETKEERIWFVDPRLNKLVSLDAKNGKRVHVVDLPLKSRNPVVFSDSSMPGLFIVQLEDGRIWRCLGPEYVPQPWMQVGGGLFGITAVDGYIATTGGAELLVYSTLQEHDKEGFVKTAPQGRQAMTARPGRPFYVKTKTGVEFGTWLASLGLFWMGDPTLVRKRFVDPMQNTHCREALKTKCPAPFGSDIWPVGDGRREVIYLSEADSCQVFAARTYGKRHRGGDLGVVYDREAPRDVCRVLIVGDSNLFYSNATFKSMSARVDHLLEIELNRLGGEKEGLPPFEVESFAERLGYTGGGTLSRAFSELDAIVSKKSEFVFILISPDSFYQQLMAFTRTPVSNDVPKVHVDGEWITGDETKKVYGPLYSALRQRIFDLSAVGKGIAVVRSATAKISIGQYWDTHAFTEDREVQSIAAKMYSKWFLMLKNKIVKKGTHLGIILIPDKSMTRISHARGGNSNSYPREYYAGRDIMTKQARRHGLIVVDTTDEILQAEAARFPMYELNGHHPDARHTEHFSNRVAAETFNQIEAFYR